MNERFIVKVHAFIGCVYGDVIFFLYQHNAQIHTHTRQQLARALFFFSFFTAREKSHQPQS